MIQLLHIFRRKATTLGLTIRICSNWPSITLAKLGLSSGPEIIRFRDGFRLKILRPLKSTWGEIFEPAIADVYQIARQAPELIIDVGANIGAFACRSAFLHSNATIHAFEPSAEHGAMLRKNIGVNGLSNVIVHDYPVTKDGREVIFSRIGAGGSSGIFLKDNSDSAIPLKSVSLDGIDFAAFESCFFKLDCEGAEGELIEWICSNLSKLPKYIVLVCEYHPWCPVPIDESLAKLKASGFSAEQKDPFDECYIFASKDH